MNDSDLQLALREWGRDFRHPVTMVVLGGVGIVLGLMGPFGTQDALTLLPRTFYWLVLAGVTYGTGSLVYELVTVWMSGATMPVRGAASGSLTGALVSLEVLGLNWLSFDIWPNSTVLMSLIATIVAISLVITGTVAFVRAQPDKAATTETPPLLDRLPVDKRGPLVALSVEDHYVRVQTTKGEDLILMRLSDAIREIGRTRGGQVHRSHWVAFDQVKAVQRKSDRAILTLSNGSEIPVSRANMSKIKEAGLLPR